MRLDNTNTGVGVGVGIGGLGTEIGIYDFLNNMWLIMRNAKYGQFWLNGQQCLGFVVASGSGYIRFGDGTQICWGTLYEKATGSEISFPVAFSAAPGCVNVTRSYGDSSTADATRDWIWMYGATATKFTVASHGTIWGHWLAIGRWK